MIQDHIRWSDKTSSIRDFKERIDDFYKRGLKLVEGRTFRGVKIDLNNPKEVIAVLYILAKEYEAFHE